jgi:hypothetical protein
MGWHYAAEKIRTDSASRSQVGSSLTGGDAEYPENSVVFCWKPGVY